MRGLTFLFIAIGIFSFCSVSAQVDSLHIKEVVAHQNEQNAEFANPEETPLTKKDLKKFEALEFYPINTKFRVEAKFIRLENEEPFEMPTSTARKPIYVKYAEAHFFIDSQSFVLTIYQNVRLAKLEGFKDYLFLPFNDLSNGFGTYGGGRFMDCKIPQGDTIIIDFNKAYNPLCAYNHKYSCPIPPEENKLDIEILAGVKGFDDH